MIDIQLLDKINASIDRESFLDFLTALQQDFDTDPDSWQNIKIDDYLESISAWIGDCGDNSVDWNKPDWNLFAKLLYVGKIYE